MHTESPRRRVLVADNNSDLAQVLGEIIRMDGSLEFAGYVSTGADALSAAVRMADTQSCT